MTSPSTRCCAEFQDAVRASTPHAWSSIPCRGSRLRWRRPFALDFRESLYRLVGALTADGVTVLMTAEVIDAFSDMRFTNERVSFVTDDILAQRYVEIDGHLEKVLAVVKMRGSDHATDFRRYHLTPSGAVIGEPLRGYHGITTGVPSLDGPRTTTRANHRTTTPAR